MPAPNGTGLYGFVVPAGTPSDVIERLNREIVAAARAKDYMDWVTQIGAEVIADTPTAFGRFIEAELERWAKVAKRAGVRVD